MGHYYVGFFDAVQKLDDIFGICDCSGEAIPVRRLGFGTFVSKKGKVQA